MIPVALYQQIYARLTGDTGSGGLFNGGTPLVTALYNTFSPAETAFPHLTFNVTGVENVDAFRCRSAMVAFDVHAFVAEELSGVDPFAKGMQIVARIRGDWEQQSGAPTYGLERWQPDLSASSWEASVVDGTGYSEQHEEGILHFVQSFQVLASRAAV